MRSTWADCRDGCPRTSAISRIIMNADEGKLGIRMGIISEFKEFLNEYKVVGLAVAFIMGAAVTALVKSLVDSIIMPIVAVVLPSGDWQTAVVELGPVKLAVGAFLAALLNFIIIAFVVFMIAKMVLKEEKVTKK